MTQTPDVNREIGDVQHKITLVKAERKRYLSVLKEVLDMYVFSVMEEEDLLYSVLLQRSEQDYFNSLKELSPSTLQFKVLINLPFNLNNIQVENGGPGFVKLQLPANSEDSMKCSKIWTDACGKGVQKRLLRHVTSWRDDSNYLKQSAILKWFSNVVNNSIEFTGGIPNYNIQRIQVENKVLIKLEDVTNNVTFVVDLLPVLAFSKNQLPQEVLDRPNVRQQLFSCDYWNAECRSNEISDDRCWGISFWQQEKQIIIQQNLKPMIDILKSLRDGCRWDLLTNYHIDTLVLLSHWQNPENFVNLERGELLLLLLLELRNRLVSREGLPFYWDQKLNLLSGLNGLQKSGMARSVTQARESLQNSSESWTNHFGYESYAPHHEPESNNESDLSERVTVTVENSNENIPQSNRIAVESMNPTSAHGNQSMLMEQQQASNSWWRIGIASAGAVGIVAAAVLGGFAMSRNNKNNRK